jgi:hypothetical protein
VETVASRLQESGQHFVKQGDAFVARTRDASVTFLGETKQAGGLLVTAVRSEAKRWRRFATQRATALQGQFQGTVRVALSLPAVERALLTQVDGTLRAIDSRVRARLTRLAQLESGKTPAKLPKKSGSSKASRARKAKPALPPIAA